MYFSCESAKMYVLHKIGQTPTLATSPLKMEGRHRQKTLKTNVKRMQQARQESARRKTENAAKSPKYHATQMENFKRAYAKFKRDFLDRHFIFGCRAHNRLWFEIHHHHFVLC